MRLLRLAVLAVGIGLAACAGRGQPGEGHGPSVVVCPPGRQCSLHPTAARTVLPDEDPKRPRTPEHSESARGLVAAAESGVPDAQYRLAALLFRGGEGTPRQPYGALQWMRRAADGGDLRAQRALGRLYMTGLEEMGQDPQEARRWLTLAAGRGDRQARRDLAELDRAEREDRDFLRALALKQAETRAIWAMLLPVAVFP
ncbi:tetratricopeptide repeat protein [Roseomonas harenae]|jgi:TPR repeat protein|uniref:tetratricopeptide repeat protein n=1 Tax=Muricoccus harenae TaxID=2692566 RepID=UPI0013316B16|nr:tetratricopeptide repeat protein [Roseomonas harenae]